MRRHPPCRRFDIRTIHIAARGFDDTHANRLERHNTLLTDAGSRRAVAGRRSTIERAATRCEPCVDVW